MIKRIHIFDVDGTIVDSSHRYRTMPCGTRIDLPYWIENECRTLEDSLLPLADHYKELLSSAEDYVICATARIWCDLTKIFFERENMVPNHVIARRDRNDTRGGAALKITGVKRLLNLRQFANVKEFHVYEDNMSYLNDVGDAFNAHKHFFPSQQGH